MFFSYIVLFHLFSLKYGQCCADYDNDTVHYDRIGGIIFFGLNKKKREKETHRVRESEAVRLDATEAQGQPAENP